jgi:hypothetical protein
MEPFSLHGGAKYIFLVSPADNATGVPTSALTLVISDIGPPRSIVLEASTGAATGQIQTTPTALPSSYPPGGSGYYAVLAPPLRSATTDAVGALGPNGRICPGDNNFTGVGSFTTQ